jgi:hypothetical protein
MPVVRPERTAASAAERGGVVGGRLPARRARSAAAATCLAGRASPPRMPVVRPERTAASAAERGGVGVRTFAGATRKVGCRRGSALAEGRQPGQGARPGRGDPTRSRRCEVASSGREGSGSHGQSRSSLGRSGSRAKARSRPAIRAHCLRRLHPTTRNPATGNPATRQPDNPTTRPRGGLAAWRLGGLATQRHRARSPTVGRPAVGGPSPRSPWPGCRLPAAGCRRRRRRRPAAAVSASRSSC